MRTQGPTTQTTYIEAKDMIDGLHKIKCNHEINKSQSSDPDYRDGECIGEAAFEFVRANPKLKYRNKIVMQTLKRGFAENGTKTDWDALVFSPDERGESLRIVLFGNVFRTNLSNLLEKLTIRDNTTLKELLNDEREQRLAIKEKQKYLVDCKKRHIENKANSDKYSIDNRAKYDKRHIDNNANSDKDRIDNKADYENEENYKNRHSESIANYKKNENEIKEYYERLFATITLHEKRTTEIEIPKIERMLNVIINKIRLQNEAVFPSHADMVDFLLDGTRLANTRGQQYATTKAF